MSLSFTSLSGTISAPGGQLGLTGILAARLHRRDHAASGSWAFASVPFSCLVRSAMSIAVPTRRRHGRQRHPDRPVADRTGETLVDLSERPRLDGWMLTDRRSKYT